MKKQSLFIQKIPFWLVPMISLPLNLIRFKTYLYKFTQSAHPPQRQMRDEDLIRIRKLGFHLFTHEGIHAAEVKQYSLQRNFSEIQFDLIIQTSSYREYLKLTGYSKEATKKFNAALLRNLNDRSYDFCEFLMFILSVQTDLRVVAGSFNRDEIQFLKTQGIRIILNFSAIHKLAWLLKNFVLLTRKALSKKVHSKNTLSDKEKNEFGGSDFSKYKVAYFPHYGIHYSNLYIKDHFYDYPNQNSPLHPSKMLHIELGAPPEMISESIQYYQKNKIPYADISEIASISLFKVFKIYLKWVLNKKSIFFRDFSYQPLFFKLFYYHFLFENFLDRMPSLQFIFEGYDILFPGFLTPLCEMRGVQLIAVQERLLGTLFPTYNAIADHYFIYALPMIKHIEENRHFFPIKKTYALGPVRLDHHYQASTQLNHENIFQKERENKKFLILVMGCHVHETIEKNRFADGNHWQNMTVFYSSILRLAKKHEDTLFIIKNKDNSLQACVPMRELCLQLENQFNIKFVTDLDSISPARITSICDGGIAIHTSLGDEMLATGKPVVFYDFFGAPNPTYQYEGLPVIALNEEQLFQMTEKMIARTLLTSDQIKFIQEKLYFNGYDGKQKERLHSYLKTILQIH